MKLSNLLKVKTRSKKRVGRGIGSGLGKTAGRGTKGQKARGKIPVGFTGAGLATFKKLPLRRGLGNPKVSTKPRTLALSALNIFKSKTVVDLEQLLKANLITKKDAEKGVKILADKELTVDLVIKLPLSKSAKLEVEKKGGSVENA
jgi:large subunit ribosomal protein L15